MTRGRTRLAALAVVALAGPLLGACGSGSDSSAGDGTSATAVSPSTEADGGSDSPGETDTDAGEEGGAADQSICAADATPVATPYDPQFPTAWTFPPGTVVYDVEDRASAGIIVTGVTTTPFDDVLAYLNDVVAKKDGFRITTGETEDDDAEANWKRGDVEGRWAIRKSGTCPGETVVQVVAFTG